jgi:hypothetical protein
MGRMSDYVIDQENRGNIVFVFGEYRATRDYIDNRKGSEPLVDTLITEEEEDDFVRQRAEWHEQVSLELEVKS